MNLATTVACVCAIGCLAVAGVSAEEAPPAVSTIAGSGAQGIHDGPAGSATFLLPNGVAVDRNGTVYVSDENAQRIRALRNGRVETVAGSGDLLPLGFSVAGGFRDGPALATRFNHPSGLAVSPDGTLYIADTKNSAIRTLHDGIVATALGVAGASGAADGDAATARLTQPRSLAFDASGALWIADFGVGLRCWDRNRLQTVVLSPPAKDVIAVAVEPDDGMIVAATPTSLYTYSPKTATSSVFSTGSADGEGSIPVGTPDAIVGLGRGQLLFTDAIASNVRYFRLPTPPFNTSMYSHIVSGGSFARPEDNAGWKDGSLESARFTTPRGLALGKGVAVVVDAGSRRIRSIVLPNFRTAEAGKNSQYRYDAEHYEIALVGPSWVFYDSHDDGDSICGNVERRLDESGKLAKPARCHTVRIDAAGVAATEQYIEANLAFRHVDAIVMSIVPGKANELDPASLAHSKVLFRESIRSLIEAIKPSGARLAILWQYYDPEISSHDAMWLRETNPNWMKAPEDVTDRTEETAIFHSLDGLPVAQYDTYDAAVAYSKGEGPPLYLSDDAHMNERGNAFYGTLLGDFLARDLPPK